jgi:hypothetical protein
LEHLKGLKIALFSKKTQKKYIFEFVNRYRTPLNIRSNGVLAAGRSLPLGMCIREPPK